MTDSVSKNLKIEDGISESLGSTYKPIHLLCKSHTVKKLDTCKLGALASFETKSNNVLCWKVLKVQPCKLYNSKYMIASTQILNTKIFTFIGALVFKLLSRKVLFTNRKDN